MTDALRARIGDELRSALSPRHVPDEILAVPAIPRTLSGKKLEVPVKRILTGTPADEAASRGSLADPTSLDPFVRARRASPRPDRRVAARRRMAAWPSTSCTPGSCGTPERGATGLPLARARIDPHDVVWAHSVPRKVAVTVRQGDDRVVARGEGLARKAGYLPMTRFALDGEEITREDRWPTQADLGAVVILPGGEAGILTHGGMPRTEAPGAGRSSSATAAADAAPVSRCSRPRRGHPTPPR